MRTETVTVYSARELRELSPRAYERALSDYVGMVVRDPDWLGEHSDSLRVALDAIGDDPPDIVGPRRVMAWAENSVLGPLRIPWTGPGRWSGARYGPSYRPGLVRPCPWTGYYVDDALLDEIKDGARRGIAPKDIARLVERRAQYLWALEVNEQCSEESFLASADVNCWEFCADGRMV